MNHSFWIRLKNVKWKDVFSVFAFIAALPWALYLRLKEKPFWLICESENEARDNGYWFFKYLREHTEQPVFYAINKSSADAAKVVPLGRVISYGTVKHWAYYLAARVNISTQKSGKPNAALCYVLEIYGLLKNCRVFLQHGITINDAEWLYYPNTRMRLFICGAQPEYDYVIERFGYPPENVAYLGFCRFDKLYQSKKSVSCRRILIMPTWREWLVSHTQMTEDVGYDGCFTASEYYLKWMELLNTPELKQLLDVCGAELVFYPHRNMQDHLEEFQVDENYVKLASWKQYDVQNLMIESDIMVTDYSSVALDYAYMHKPVLFYQFDQEQFRKGQYKQGYFRYEDMGPVCPDAKSLVAALRRHVECDYMLDVQYKKYIEEFFVLRDSDNCHRTYEKIRQMDSGAGK